MTKKLYTIILMLLMVAGVLSFSACTKQKSTMDYMVLVNKEYKLPDTWEEELEITDFTNSVGDKVEVETKAYQAYQKLKEDVEKELNAGGEREVCLELDSAYRSVAAQQEIWDDFTEKYGEDYTKSHVAVPGYSEHHTGLALDLYFTIDGKNVYENEDLVKHPDIWKTIHGKLSDHGFILRYLEGKEDITGYNYEPWHIRYLDSKDKAKEIRDKGITLEEYLDKLPESDVSP